MSKTSAKRPAGHPHKRSRDPQRGAASTAHEAPQPSSGIAAWYEEQYLASVGVAGVEGGEKFKGLLAGLPARAPSADAPYPMTGRQRMGSFLHLKLRYPLGQEGYTCLAMRAEGGGHAAHYAFAYWRRGREAADPEYICVSPTFDSRDGEYRHRFICYPAFAKAYESLAAELEPAEGAVLSLVAEGALELGAGSYPEAAAESAAEAGRASRLVVQAFTVALALDLWEAARGGLMVHTSAGYAGLMRSVAAARPPLAAALEALNRTQHGLQLFYRGSVEAEAVQCGQKLVPMYVREAMQAHDYNLAVWRELAVTRLVGDLVLNFVAPAFSHYNQATYIEGADASLFENRAMEDRYARSRAADEAVHSLREARQRLGPPAAGYHLAELGAHVYESIEYAQSYLLMAPTALVHTMEDVGWSLRSLGPIVRSSLDQWPAAAGAFATLDSAAHYLFDAAYGAHCLHTKLGVAHTDLHGNNLTFYMWGLADRMVVADGGVRFEAHYADPVAVYLAGPRGEADAYVFPATGASCCLIDYSRCLLGPAFRARLERGRTARYSAHFYRDQVNRVMRALHRYAPAFVAKNEVALKAAVLANYEAAFPVLCAVDFIALGRSVAAALVDAGTPGADAGAARPFKVARAGIDLALRLEREAQELFVTGLHDLAEAAGSRRQMPPPAFPGAALLRGVFGEWQYSRWAAREPARLRTASVVDCWNYGNELRYSGADYGQWPPWARLDEIERHLGGLKITELFERGVEPFLEALRPGARVEVIAERVRAEQEKLDGAPVSTASSWLDE